MNVQEVANTVGVSKSTVYRALRAKSDISPETMAAIQSAIKQAGYTPRFYKSRNGPPKAAFRGNIGLLFWDTMNTAPLTAKLLHGFTEAFSDKDLNMMLVKFDGTGDLPRCIKENTIDGLIVRPGFHGRRIASRLDGAVPSIPTVWLFQQPREYWIDNVDAVAPDEDKVALKLFRFLYDRGHRNLAFFNLWPKHPSNIERIKVFTEAADKTNCKVSIFAMDHDRDRDPTKLVDEMLSMHERPTGIYLGQSTSDDRNMMENMIVYQTLMQKGVVPGKDIDLVGCMNSLPNTDWQQYPIANVDIRAQEVAKTAVEMLLWRLENPDRPKRRALIDPEVVLPLAP
jgi:DNA-binding LacI/PurR family transcriptional regulator